MRSGCSTSSAEGPAVAATRSASSSSMGSVGSSVPMAEGSDSLADDDGGRGTEY